MAQEALQAYREAKETLDHAQQSLETLQGLEETAKQKAQGNETLMQKYYEQVEQAQKAAEAAQQQVAQLKAGVVKEVVKVLNGQVTIDPKVLTALEEGKTNVMQAAGNQQICFEFDIDNPSADRAADLFSAWTTEIAMEDPELAAQITKALASQKIEELLG